MPKYIDVDSSAYDYSTLVDWLISSVGPEPPVWTEPHIEELLEDFYVVPKSTPLADVVEVVRCQECICWEPASPTRTSGNCNRAFEITAWATDFCSYGERRDGGQDDV